MRMDLYSGGIKASLYNVYNVFSVNFDIIVIEETSKFTTESHKMFYWPALFLCFLWQVTNTH